MRDVIKTRIKLEAVTSYAADKDVNYADSTSWPTIRLTIGSVLLVLKYVSNDDRDLDMHDLDHPWVKNEL